MPTNPIQYILDYMNIYFVDLPRRQVFVGYNERHDLLEKEFFNKGSQGSYWQEKSRKLCFRKHQEESGKDRKLH